MRYGNGTQMTAVVVGLLVEYVCQDFSQIYLLFYGLFLTTAVVVIFNITLNFVAKKIMGVVVGERGIYIYEINISFLKLLSLLKNRK